MKLITIVFLLLLYGCDSKVKYPDGGYEYPKNVSVKDSNLYFYPIKDVESKKYAFGDYYSYLLYQWFEEPNLSIKPFAYDIFRITYEDAFGDRKIIILRDGLLTVKEGNTDGLYEDGTIQLDSIEQLHLRLLDRFFPIEEIDRKSKYRKYLDSMTNAFPALLDPGYYHKLYEKSFIKTTKKFKYKTSNVALSGKEYASLIKELNESGFWTLPYVLECAQQYDIADGDLFTFEANTQHKYQFVRVYGCPNNETRFTILCQKIIHLAKLDREVDLIWKESVDTTNEYRKKE
jgi:hypothetical protein